MKHIVLMGFMGCGKSSIGTLLSQKMQIELLDTDTQIEQLENISIPQLFEKYGETYFREKETEVLKLLQQENRQKIISLGGGTPLREENRRYIKELGIVIYLNVSADTVYERLKGDTSRPLLQGENPKEKIEKLLKERAYIYESTADITICVDHKTKEEIVAEIMEVLA